MSFPVAVERCCERRPQRCPVCWIGDGEASNTDSEVSCWRERGQTGVQVGFETRAGSLRIENATVPKVILDWSGRKSAGEQELRRAESGKSHFSPYFENAAQGSIPALSGLRPVTTMLRPCSRFESLYRAAQVGE